MNEDSIILGTIGYKTENGTVYDVLVGITREGNPVASLIKYNDQKAKIENDGEVISDNLTSITSYDKKAIFSYGPDQDSRKSYKTSELTEMHLDHDIIDILISGGIMQPMVPPNEMEREKEHATKRAANYIKAVLEEVKELDKIQEPLPDEPQNTGRSM